MENTKRRKATIRLSGYDYSEDGLYFITICVKDRQCCLGEVVAEEMILNPYGQIVEGQWGWLLHRYPYLESHAFVVMPNHVHAVLEIRRALIQEKNEALAARGLNDESAHLTRLIAGLRSHPIQQSQLAEQPIKIKPLDQLLGAYKTTSSKMIHGAGFLKFHWQRSYHDHIINDEDDYERIVAYIRSNPANWHQDRFYGKMADE